jgi:hypothetical protein
MKKLIIILIILVVLSFLPLIRTTDPVATCINDNGQKAACGTDNISFWKAIIKK